MDGLSDEKYPTRLFALFVLFYAGQSIYNTYLNLYLSDVGLQDGQIGLIVSISTIFILIGQVIWGSASDRTSTKNRVLQLLFTACTVISLLFYLNTSFGYLLLAVTLFSMFFQPIIPLLDNFALESLEGKKWDYGRIRMGGTIGYCTTVLIIGIVVDNHYRSIFWIIALFLGACRLLCGSLPKVKGYQEPSKNISYGVLLQNKTLLALILFNMAFTIGLSFYNNFYPIYFTTIGGSSSLVGLMIFLAALTEIPMLFFVQRLTRRLGIRKLLLLAGSLTTVRWFLLSIIRTPAAAICVNLLQGVGYTSFSYSLVTYIARSIPKQLRATGQTLNALIGNVVSRMIFGFLGGLGSQFIGTNTMMRISAGFILSATILFGIWSRNNQELCRSA